MKRLFNSSGFNLLELMIVLAIVGILAAVATPAYVSHVYKTRETIAHQYILDVQAAQEKFYALNDRYSANVAGLTSHLSFDTADTQFYVLTMIAASTNTYTAQVAADINQDGVYSNCTRILPPPAQPVPEIAAGSCADKNEGFKISLIAGLF